MCHGTSNDGQLQISEDELQSRCQADAACVGYAQYLDDHKQPNLLFRPVTAITSVNSADPHWLTWKKTDVPPPAPPASKQPSHVHIWGGKAPSSSSSTSNNGRQTYSTVGFWTDGSPGHAGMWSGFDGAGQRTVDAGPYYAGKDFYDPVKQRRILWGWIADYSRYRDCLLFSLACGVGCWRWGVVWCCCLHHFFLFFLSFLFAMQGSHGPFPSSYFIPVKGYRQWIYRCNQYRGK